MSFMSFNLTQLTDQLNRVKQQSKQLDRDELIRKYGTFLDSKKEIVQLYLLFFVFGVDWNLLTKEGSLSSLSSMTEYDPD